MFSKDNVYLVEIAQIGKLDFPSIATEDVVEALEGAAQLEASWRMKGVLIKFGPVLS